jgi:hypothetical protein
MTTLASKLANVLAPYFGEHSADAVAHHICAKCAIDDETAREKLDGLRDFLRRGLVVYVGAVKAQEIAGHCIETIAESTSTGPN